MTTDANVCPTCGGILEDKTVQVDFRYKDRLVVIDDVPAQVCRDCGERLISSATSKDIDELLELSPEPVRRISVPVLPFRRRAPA